MRLVENLRLNGRGVRRGLSLLVVVAAGAAALPAVAGALPPDRSTEQIDDTFVEPAAPNGPCAFPVQIHFTAQLESTRFFDRDGNEIRTLTRFLSASATFSANGKSITDRQGGIQHITFDPETGTSTLALTGLTGHLIVPGQGVVAQDSGRVVLFFESPEDEEPDVLFEGGRHDGGPFPALCEILAP